MKFALLKSISNIPDFSMAQGKDQGTSPSLCINFCAEEFAANNYLLYT